MKSLATFCNVLAWLFLVPAGIHLYCAFNGRKESILWAGFNIALSVVFKFQNMIYSEYRK